MKKPRVDCPACRGVRKPVDRDSYVSICGILFEKIESGDTTYPNFDIVPEHCMQYTKCHVWRDERERDWKNRVASRTLEKADKISL